MIDFSVHNKKNVKLFIVIVPRGKGKVVTETVRELGVLVKLVVLGEGTADSKILDYLGFGQTEKDVVFFFAGAELSGVLMKKLNSGLNLGEHNAGIAFSLPVSGVGGMKTLAMLSGFSHLIDIDKGEDSMDTVSENKTLFDLIITIVNRGFADDVMAAAKSKGAEGGTIIHARGAGIHETEKFFGISIQPEKEMVLTLVPRNIKADIIKEIGEKAGLMTPGKGICFSLPVDDVVGIVHLMKKSEDNK